MADITQRARLPPSSRTPPKPALPTTRGHKMDQQQRPNSAPTYRSRASPPKAGLAPTGSHFKARPPTRLGAFELKVQITGLPRSYGTLELYKTFCHLGNLVRIEIENANEGVGSRGYVTFRPAPRQDSELLRRFQVREANGTTHKVTCKVWEQTPYERESPINTMKKFPEIMKVPMAKLDVGTMLEHDHVLALRTVMPMHGAPLEMQLDLRLQVMELVFGVELPDGRNHGGQAQRYKIRIALTQLRQVKKAPLQDGQVNLILSLDLPPLLFRKANNVEDTHEPGNNMWYEGLTWYRQTGIDVARDGRAAVTKLPQGPATYDTGRWLSFSITIDGNVASSKDFNTIGQALIDHNVDVTQTEQIRFSTGNAGHLWDWLEHPRKADLASASASLLGELDFGVQYQLQVCLSQGILHECNLSHEWIQQLAALEPARAVKILEKATTDKRRCYDPMEVFRLQSQVSVKQKNIPKYCALMRAAVITPSTIYFATPAVETSNRVIRRYKHYEDRFLRVKFTDERYVGRIMASADNTKNELLTRVKRTMTNGIQIGDRHYDFLAFGNSQFRESGAVFFASTSDLTADRIRAEMGDFTKIPTVAKYASRIGQCFSTTRGMKLGVLMTGIPDIERNGFCFTDGIGKISPFLAQMVAEELGLPNPLVDYPSVFQFRLGGAKGVVAVDPALKGKTVQLRPSQEKFPAEYHGLEICRISQFSSAYLNMQVILVLDALGVPPSAFIQKMRETLSYVQEAMTNPKKASEQLLKKVDYNRITVTLALMVDDGFMDAGDPFMMSCLNLWRSWMIKYLKEKARIFVDDGAFVLGCIDETATLKGHLDPSPTQTTDPTGDTDLAEIFIQIPDPAVRGRYRVIEGICTLTRNPCLHPGDIRVVRAVDVAQLHHLKDCVVLPQNGDRDLANMCAGGDLDGDDYLVMWDDALLPREWNHAPMDYQTPPAVLSDGPVTVDDITSFFVAHMKNDNLGRLAVAHRYWADQLQDSVKDERCLELAQLNSMAVDYAKTGVPAEMPKRLRISRWPHWSEVKKKGEKGWYESKKVLGLLYDEVDRVPFDRAAWTLPFDQRILDAYEIDDKMRAEAMEIKQQYDEAVRRIMAQYGIKTEFEIWTTFALECSLGLSDYKLAESLGETVQSLKEHHREMCYEQAGTNAKERDWQKLAPFIAAMYIVTAEEVSVVVADRKQEKMVGGQIVPVKEMEFANMPFMSFPWIFARELGQIANKRSAPTHTYSASYSRPMPKKSNTDGLGSEMDLEPLQVISMADGMSAIHSGQVLDMFHRHAPMSNVKSQEAEAVSQSATSKEEQLRSSSFIAAELQSLTHALDGIMISDNVRPDAKTVQNGNLEENAEGESSDDVEDEEVVVITMDEKPSALGAFEKLLARDS